MKFPHLQVPFIAAFFGLGFALTLVFVSLFLRCASNDEFLASYFANWAQDRQAAFLLGQFLLMPLAAVLVAAWWVLRIRVRNLTRPPWLTVRAIVILVVMAFVLNFVLLESLLRLNGEFRRSAHYYAYLCARSAALSPIFLFADLLFVGVGLWSVLKPHGSGVNEIDRLGILAMCLANIAGLLLLSLVRL